MGWAKLRPWLALIGPLLAVVILTAVPAGAQAGGLPWPKSLMAGLVAGSGILAALWKPSLDAWAQAKAARATRRAERAAQAEDALGRLPGAAGRPLLVEEVADRALLGIHEALPLPVGAAQEYGLSPELPRYVPRDIDADLRTALQAMTTTGGGFVLLVGPAAAGKTRCAWEAVRAVVPRWRLLMPATAADLTALVDGGSALQRCVVWLNEMQQFLTGPDPLKAATVRRLLADRVHPVILIGTIWATTYEQLRRPARGEGDAGAGEDLNQNSREVLELARRFPLAGWSGPEWERARELAAQDPRIAQATRHRGDDGIAQLLSAAPELIHRWQLADDPYGQAVITTAVSARRCGHPQPLPAPLLQALAPDYLTGAQRAAAEETWIAPALQWACRPVLHSGGIAPLQPHADTPGQVMGYTVSDILIDHTTPSTDIPQQIPAPFWTRLTALAIPQACVPIGLAAYNANMPDHARAAFQRAADAGETDAMYGLGFLLAEQGEVEEARAWYTRAANAGDTDAMFNLGVLLKQQGEKEKAQAWYTRAANAEHTGAMVNLGLLLVEQGEVEEARFWYTRAANAGHTMAMFNLGVLLVEQGEGGKARSWFTRAANAGHTGAMFNLGILLKQQGEVEEARSWYTRAANAGHTGAMFNLGVLLKQQGEVEEARAWYTRAANAGDTDAMFNLGVLLKQQGEVEEARSWYTRAANAGDTDAMDALARLAEDEN